ncbi:transglycosylase SLT domain-containing protein [Acetobacter conturbans]|uniref:Transglycosylase SLT domain-containing protein n=1 Tax=Acetobacter conturbans TaxID=1737472 RepID=A0ABX0JX12_9PROT|nr:transglycosylase SLT domain-containing protein [Acetobacter conturbans]NHN87298.1 transglycosylase SLT domain-containing protein [Acetobacter conturbans]
MHQAPEPSPLKHRPPFPSPTALKTVWQASRPARLPAILGLLALLSACAGEGPQSDMQIPIAQEEARYRAHAKSYYAPPGSSDDPWGPYIAEASQRFDVPEIWIRSVIQRESGGRLYHNGDLVTSAPGAMGLMQLMPPTYDAMRDQNNLGGDPYDPHDNVLAGTAYIRQMYDIYGSPGFLAAYNAGPGRLEDFISRSRTLPRETRNYVAAIGREIAGIYPNNRSQADLLVASHTSGQNAAYAAAAMPSGTSTNVRNAWAQKGSGTTAQPVEVAEAPGTAEDDTTPVSVAPAYTRQYAPVSHSAESPQSVNAVWEARLKSEGDTSGSTASEEAVPVSTAAPSQPVVINDSAIPSRPSRVRNSGFSLTSQAAAATPSRSIVHSRDNSASAAAMAGTRNWGIQVGAFSSPSLAQAATSRARSRASSDLSTARTQIASVRVQRGQLYRARLTGLSRSEAVAACQRLDGGVSNCVVVSPEGI